MKSNISLKEAWRNFVKRDDVVVAVVDTGIDFNHPFLQSNQFKGVISPRKPANVRYGVDFSKGRKGLYMPFDEHGHGTHVSGIIRSVYPGVKILTLKYYNPKASGMDNLKSTIAALRYAVDLGVDIINYSGGGPEISLEERTILKRAEGLGILVVAAAGNERSNIDYPQNAYYPASYGLKNIITVGAHDQNLNIIASSNYGKKSVHIAAPGYQITSSLPFGRFGKLTGTSQATAFVSGAAALLKAQFPELTNMEVKEAILSGVRKDSKFVGKITTEGRLDVKGAQEKARKMWKSRVKVRKIATENEKRKWKISS